jgi:hypothetical protein
MWVPMLLIACTALFYVVGASAVITGPPAASPSSFQANDGNMTLEGATALAKKTDWNCFVGTDGFVSAALVTKPANCAVSTGAKNVAADAGGETSWVNGQKFDTQCPALAVNNNPPKDEFTDVASYTETDPTTLNVFFYGASTRATANGNASGDVEFNQVAGNGTSSAGCRTAGDRLVAYDFLNGGTGIDLHVLTWIDPTNLTIGGNSGTCFVKTDSPSPTGCWGAFVIHPSNADTSILEGQSNNGLNGVTGAIAASDNGLNNTALAINQFAEFGVNLSAVLGTGSACLSFPQEVWESRSSGSSFTSNPQDIEIENQTIKNCGEVKIIKATDPAAQNQNFSYTSTLAGSEISCTVTSAASFTLNAGGTTTQDCTKVPTGSYTVTEGAPPTGWSLKTLSCSVDGTGGSTGAQDGTNPLQANITLKAGDTVTCTYTNQAKAEIKIIKRTNPRGIDQSFSYSSTVTGNTSFNLNDTGNTSSDSSGNTKDITNVALGSYTVTETEPPGWTLGSLSCTASGTGSSGSQHAAGSLQADITVGAGGLVTCVYVNNAPSGAIVITKKTSKTAGTALGGAKFQVCTNAGPYDPTTNPCVAPSGVTNPVGPSDATTGKVCVDGLFWNGTGTDYYVQETVSPDGYSIDDATAKKVTVSANASCPSTGTPATITFFDTPLTTLEVIATSEAANHGSKSKISCVDSATPPNTVGTSITTFTDPADWKTQHLKPDTYTCTVVIDP